MNQYTINNEKRPSEEGLYIVIYTDGHEGVCFFDGSHWIVTYNHPVEKYINMVIKHGDIEYKEKTANTVLGKIWLELRKLIAIKMFNWLLDITPDGEFKKRYIFFIRENIMRL